MPRALFLASLFVCLTYLCMGCGDRETGVLGNGSIGVDLGGAGASSGSQGGAQGGEQDTGSDGGHDHDSKVEPPKDHLPDHGDCDKPVKDAKNLTVSVEAIVKTSSASGKKDGDEVLGAWALGDKTIDVVVPVDFGKVKDALDTGYGDSLFVLSLCSDSNKNGSCLDGEKIYFQVSVKVATAMAALNSVQEFPIKLNVPGATDPIVIRLTGK